MKRIHLLPIGALALVWAVTASAEEPKAATPAHDHAHMAAPAAAAQTLQGEVLDMACYMGHEAKGEKHKACAQACIKGGAPMGILTADGKVILLVEDHEKTKPYEALKALGGEQVRVSGAMYERGGLAALVVATADPVR